MRLCTQGGCRMEESKFCRHIKKGNLLSYTTQGGQLELTYREGNNALPRNHRLSIKKKTYQ